MASNANLRLVGTVVTMQRELVMAFVTLLNVNDWASRNSICVRDRRVEHGVGNGDAFERAVIIYIYSRMCFGPPLKEPYKRWKKTPEEIIHWDVFDQNNFMTDEELDIWITKKRHKVMYKDAAKIDCPNISGGEALTDSSIRDGTQLIPVPDLDFAAWRVDNSRAFHISHQATNGFFAQSKKTGYIHTREGQSERAIAML